AFGEFHGRQPDRMVPAAEGVVGMGIPELGHGADVSGRELYYRDALLALLHREMVQLLGHAMLGVPDFLAVLERAGIGPENRDVSHVRLRHRLEDPSHQWR